MEWASFSTSRAPPSIERMLQYAWPIALQIGLAPWSARRRPVLGFDENGGNESEGDDNQQRPHAAPPRALIIAPNRKCGTQNSASRIQTGMVVCYLHSECCRRFALQWRASQW